MSDADRLSTAFDGSSIFARGRLAEVALAVRERLDGRPEATLLTFDDATGRVIDLDLRGTPAEIVARLGDEPRGRGRPKLGVVAREVTLLPRHWEWLSAQPGGASQALRRLIDEARRGDRGETQGRIAREAAYRFMNALAGNLPGFEEATRALFANDEVGFFRQAASWPADIRTYAQELAWSAVRDED
ncbi:DUF2239 family protein [Bosea vestrisii]|jgi:hypothetical protein|uniref:DUF2239 family protein n=1 Tax=Bosea vestrisii TaxID=151416 RepID=A0ABW0HJN4_9HYPH